jgi:hypothetical protein
MWTILIGAVIGAILGFILGDEDKGQCSFGAGVAGLMLGFFVCFMGGLFFIDSGYKTKEVNKTELELVQIKLDKTVSGSFFLGCGGVGSHAEYYAYTKNSADEIQLDSYSIYRSKIVYTEDAPKIQIYDLKPVTVWSKFFFISSSEGHYRFFIPEDSIISSYDVNIK